MHETGFCYVGHSDTPREKRRLSRRREHDSRGLLERKCTGGVRALPCAFALRRPGLHSRTGFCRGNRRENRWEHPLCPRKAYRGGWYGQGLHFLPSPFGSPGLSKTRNRQSFDFPFVRKCERDGSYRRRHPWPPLELRGPRIPKLHSEEHLFRRRIFLLRHARQRTRPEHLGW